MCVSFLFCQYLARHILQSGKCFQRFFCHIIILISISTGRSMKSCTRGFPGYIKNLTRNLPGMKATHVWVSLFHNKLTHLTYCLSRNLVNIFYFADIWLGIYCNPENVSRALFAISLFWYRSLLEGVWNVAQEVSLVISKTWPGTYLVWKQHDYDITKNNLETYMIWKQRSPYY